MYRIVLTKQVHKILLKLPRNTANLIRQKLENLANDPYGDNPNVKKLHNRPGYRLRVGDWRVIYEIQDDELIILVLRVAPRGEVYR